ncbi:PH domain-containing protein [Actinopolyspora mzabensis]|uniref:PH domain-containing protein n=1 Tax=Actinopolyspora mzabensis TaxID=995066 RepID=A0A1G9FBF5_ACTMZ|nr:PH domain-containing protein [Actinopolyspora mzabensis]SDK85670.1 PH domain-containing protein [Actinopolyspora mzabensis]
MNDSQENDRLSAPKAGEEPPRPETTGTEEQGAGSPGETGTETGQEAAPEAGDTDETASGAPETTTEREPEHPPEGDSEQAEPPELPPRLVFRITRVSLLVILVLAFCISPVAASLPPLSVLYLIPLGLIVWVVRTRTVVDESGITARTLTGATRMDWSDIRALRLHERRWVRAVTTSDREVRLPALRVRDVPRLATMSRGRIQDPSRPKDADAD